MYKLQWFNENIQYMFRKNIVEYDMQAASLSVSRRYNLLDENLLIQLENTPKEKRTVQVGLMQKHDKEFSDKMLSGIIQTRQEFLESNHLNNSNIICLHSDAVIFEQSCAKIHDKIDCVQFIKKNQWSSYLRYNGIEMYYGDGHIDYKGIPRESLKYHTLGINKFLLQVFDMIENYDENIIPFLRKFQMRYMQDRLPEYYYIPFGRHGEHKRDNLKLFAFIANVVLGDMYEQHW